MKTLKVIFKKTLDKIIKNEAVKTFQILPGYKGIFLIQNYKKIFWLLNKHCQKVTQIFKRLLFVWGWKRQLTNTFCQLQLRAKNWKRNMKVIGFMFSKNENQMLSKEKILRLTTVANNNSLYDRLSLARKWYEQISYAWTVNTRFEFFLICAFQTLYCDEITYNKIIPKGCAALL